MSTTESNNVTPIRRAQQELLIVFEKPKQEMKLVTLSKIDAEVWNSRDKIDPAASAFLELEASIRESGMKQNIVITPKLDDKNQPCIDERGREYELVSGFRRFKVLTKIGTKAASCLVETYNHPAQRIITNIVENTQRAKLKPYELATACLKLKEMGFKSKQIAAWIKYSETHVSGLLGCAQNLIPQLATIFKSQEENNATLSDLMVTSRMTNAEQEAFYRNLLDQKERIRTAPSDDVKGGSEKDDSIPKMKKRDAVLAAIGDLHRAESVIVKGDPVFIRDDEERQKIITVLRWVAGELKKSPIALPPDDLSDKKDSGAKRAASSRR